MLFRHKLFIVEQLSTMKSFLLLYYVCYLFIYAVASWICVTDSGNTLHVRHWQKYSTISVIWTGAVGLTLLENTDDICVYAAKYALTETFLRQTWILIILYVVFSYDKIWIHSRGRTWTCKRIYLQFTSLSSKLHEKLYCLFTFIRYGIIDAFTLASWTLVLQFNRE
jgi:hypothetical protein